MLEISFSSFYVLLLQCVHWKNTELSQMEGSCIECKIFLVLMNSAEALLKFTSKESSCMTVQKTVMYSLDAVRKIGVSLRGIKVSLHERL